MFYLWLREANQTLPLENFSKWQPPLEMANDLRLLRCALFYPQKILINDKRQKIDVKVHIPSHLTGMSVFFQINDQSETTNLKK